MEYETYFKCITAIGAGRLDDMYMLLLNENVDLDQLFVFGSGEHRKVYSIASRIMLVKDGMFLEFHDLFVEYGVKYTPKDYWDIACYFIKYNRLNNLKDMTDFEIWDVNKTFKPNGSTPLHCLYHIFNYNNEVCKGMFEYLCKKDKDGKRLGKFDIEAGYQGDKITPMDIIIDHINRKNLKWKYEEFFLPYFEPVEITRCLRNVPTSNSHQSILDREALLAKIKKEQANKTVNFRLVK